MFFEDNFISNSCLSLFLLKEKVTKPACLPAGSSRTTRSAPRVCPANASPYSKMHLSFEGIIRVSNSSEHLNCTRKPSTAKPYPQILKSFLGNVAALARTDARSDHAVLDFLGTFCIKTKGANKNLL